MSNPLDDNLQLPHIQEELEAQSTDLGQMEGYLSDIKTAIVPDLIDVLALILTEIQGTNSLLTTIDSVLDTIASNTSILTTSPLPVDQV